MYTVERYHDICAGHRVMGHEGKCRHLHGHNYRITFTAAPIPGGGTHLDHVGRVIDFGILKSTVCDWLEQAWDHKMILHLDDPLAPYLQEQDPGGVYLTNFNPTAENMAKYLVTVIGPQELMKFGVYLVSCRVEETRKCSATYSLAPNEPIPSAYLHGAGVQLAMDIPPRRREP